MCGIAGSLRSRPFHPVESNRKYARIDSHSRAIMATISILELTPDRIRVWGFRSSVAILDQGLTSGSSLVLNLLLARWLPTETYGAFAVAFAGFLFASGFHNVLLLEPMSVFGPTRYAGQLRSYFRSNVTAHAALVGPLSALVLLGGVAMAFHGSQQLAGALLGGGIALPFLLLLWLVRRMCYVGQRPSVALFASSFSLIVISGGLFGLHERRALTPFTAFALTGVASLFASLLDRASLGLWDSLPVKGLHRLGRRCSGKIGITDAGL